MSNKSQSAAWITALIFLASGCSRSPDGNTAAQLGSVSDPPTAYKFYNASSLVEIRDFADLPEAVKNKLLHGPMANGGGEGPGGRCCEFVLGGVSPTSAVVAYELFGYVPSFQATAFVHTDSGWIEAGQWRIGPVNSLQRLREMTNRPPDFWGHAR
jgi:hypothetical protein